MNKNKYQEGITSGKKCVGCYTTRFVYYCFTSLEGKTWESCESCLDKVRKIRDEYFKKINNE